VDVDIDIGARVWSSDGQQVGTVSGVVIDPERDVVTDLVVREGDLFNVDLVVPIEMVAEIQDHRVTLTISGEEVDSQPLLNERAYIPLAPGGKSAPRMWTPTPGVAIAPMLNPAWNAPPVVEEDWREVPAEDLILREGLPVRAADGELVGRVDELVEDVQSHRMEAVVVRGARGKKHDKAIPAQWIARSDEDTGITLVVDAGAVEQLPDYH